MFQNQAAPNLQYILDISNLPSQGFSDMTILFF